MNRVRLAFVAFLLLAVGAPVGWRVARPADSVGEPVARAGRLDPTPGAAASARAGGAAPGSGAAASAGASPATGAPGTVSVPTRAATLTPAGASGSTTSPAPARLLIPGIGVDAAVLAVGVEPSGFMTVPASASEVGWYRFGPAPGADRGSAVIAGHVDARAQGAGALFRLREVGVGDQVEVRRDGAPPLRYRVIAKETIVKSRLPVEQLFARDGSSRLVLITCGGPFQPDLGSYRDNVVVVATPVTP